MSIKVNQCQAMSMPSNVKSIVVKQCQSIQAMSIQGQAMSMSIKVNQCQAMSINVNQAQSSSSNFNQGVAMQSMSINVNQV